MARNSDRQFSESESLNAKDMGAYIPEAEERLPAWAMEIERLASQVFVIQSSLPCMANMALFAAYYGADKEFASIAVATSTLLAMLTVPAWMAVISAAGL